MKEQLLMCFGACKGMVYLEKMQIIHRDLACRNLLVDRDNTVKVGDFGLAHISNKESAVYFNEGAMPIRWTAPECLLRDGFTSKSDVWSYGITVWEILTFAERPYSKLETAKDVTKFIIGGGRLGRPENCPDPLWELLNLCWIEDRDKRPSFADVVDKLELIIQSMFVETEIESSIGAKDEYHLSPNLIGYETNYVGVNSSTPPTAYLPSSALMEDSRSEFKTQDSPKKKRIEGYE